MGGYRRRGDMREVEKGKGEKEEEIRRGGKGREGIGGEDEEMFSFSLIYVLLVSYSSQTDFFT
jgi:hypothetical protein